MHLNKLYFLFRFQQSDRSHYSIPQFLLPESPHERPVVPRDDSDMEDEYEDDTTQGQLILS